MFHDGLFSSPLTDRPPLPQMASIDLSTETSIKDLFLLDSKHTFLNNGSYGTVPRVVTEEQNKLRLEMESNPDRWYQETLDGLWLRNLTAIAEFVGSKTENLVFVSNATSGVNIALKSLPLTTGDGILTNSFTYKAIYNACMETVRRVDGSVHILQLDLLHLTSDSIIQSYTEYLKQHPDVKVVMLDGISSSTAIKYPYKELVKVCHRAQCVVIVDAAHLPGQLTVNLEELGQLGCDFFIGNLHKWLFTPRGCAILWVSPKHHDLTRPVVTSHCYRTGHLHRDFFTQGTIDYTPYCSAEVGLNFYKRFGGTDKMNAFTSELLDAAEKLLTDAWGVSGCPLPQELRAPNMRLIPLPGGLAPDLAVPFKNNWPFNDLRPLKKVFRDKFNLTAVPLYVQDVAYVRLSAQVYNKLEDYEVLKQAILDLKQ